MIDPAIIAAIVQMGGQLVGGYAKRQAQKKAYEQQLQALEEMQGLERQGVEEDLGYQIGMARRSVGETGAATGITGAPIMRRLGDIEALRRRKLRDLYWNQLREKKRLELEQAGAKETASADATSQMYTNLGNVGANRFQRYMEGKPADTTDTTTTPATYSRGKYLRIPELSSAYQRSPYPYKLNYNPYKNYYNYGGY